MVKNKLSKDFKKGQTVLSHNKKLKVVNDAGFIENGIKYIPCADEDNDIDDYPIDELLPYIEEFEIKAVTYAKNKADEICGKEKIYSDIWNSEYKISFLKKMRNLLADNKLDSEKSIQTSKKTKKNLDIESFKEYISKFSTKDQAQMLHLFLCDFFKKDLNNSKSKDLNIVISNLCKIINNE